LKPHGELAFTVRHVCMSFTADMVAMQGYMPNEAVKVLAAAAGDSAAVAAVPA